MNNLYLENYSLDEEVDSLLDEEFGDKESTSNKEIILEGDLFENINENLILDEIINECLSYSNILNESEIKDLELKSDKVTLEKINKARRDFKYNLKYDKNFMNKYKGQLNNITDKLSKLNFNTKDKNELKENYKMCFQEFADFMPNVLLEISDILGENLNDIMDAIGLDEEWIKKHNSDVLPKIIKSFILISVPIFINSMVLFICQFIVNCVFSKYTTVVNGELYFKKGCDDKIDSLTKTVSFTNFLVTSISAPITEEIAKLTAERYIGSIEILGKDLSAYNIVFNATEFSLYLYKNVFGVNKNFFSGNLLTRLTKNTAIRIPAIIMHSFNTYLIKKGVSKKDIKEKTNNDDIFAGRITMLTILIHGMFNAISVNLCSKMANRKET